jgi:hypothetical protein
MSLFKIPPSIASDVNSTLDIILSFENEDRLGYFSCLVEEAHEGKNSEVLYHVLRSSGEEVLAGLDQVVRISMIKVLRDNVSKFPLAHRGFLGTWGGALPRAPPPPTEVVVEELFVENKTSDEGGEIIEDKSEQEQNEGENETVESLPVFQVPEYISLAAALNPFAHLCQVILELLKHAPERRLRSSRAMVLCQALHIPVPLLMRSLGKFVHWSHAGVENEIIFLNKNQIKSLNISQVEPGGGGVEEFGGEERDKGIFVPSSTVSRITKEIKV